jgi:hypothetical protein
MTKKESGSLRLGLMLASYAMLPSLGCGEPGSIGSPSSGGGVAGSVNINLTAGAGGGVSSNGGAAGAVVPSSAAGNCGTFTSDTTRAGADVLIVLDRSESMTWSLTTDSACGANDPSCSSRIAAVVPAVSTVVADNPGIQWGLELFSAPDGTRCQVEDAPQVPIGPDSAAAIQSRLAALTTQTSTPTTAALTAATSYLRTVNDSNNKAILLATDGLPNCGSGGGGGTGSDDLPGATAASAAARQAGFPVYVIGIGPNLSNLEALAQAGGTGNYYPVTSTAALNAALSSIAQVVAATCTFKANTTPPDKDLVYVYVDKRLVNQSDSNGWIFDPSDPTYSTIVLTGRVCEDMLAGVTTQVQILFGCPNTAPPGVIP